MRDATLVVFIILGMIILLVISISVLWFFYYTQNKIMKLKMQEQANKIVYHKNLLLNTVKTQENERQRIAADLHDDVASKLNVVHLNIHLLKKRMDAHPENDKIIDQIETSLKESINRTRVISHELMPQVLKKFGFHYALNELAQSVNASGGIHIDIKDEHLCVIRDDFKLLHLFRIIQELINNTIKYAKAQNIDISFTQKSDDIIMTYADDGIGFDTTKPATGLGLFNISSRAELMEGVANFNHEIGMGCHFTLKFRKDD